MILINQEIRIHQLQSEYNDIAARIAFYRKQMEVVCEANNYTDVKDFDMNLKKLAGKVAYLNRQLTPVRNKIALIKQ